MCDLEPYTPSSSFIHLTPEVFVPTHRFKLSHTPTPCHIWNLSGLPEDVALYIKRDDYTGVELSGNKIRKLDFLLADAVQKGFTSVITQGAAQSNHVRATVFACRRIGLTPYAVVREGAGIPTTSDVFKGNPFLDLIADGHLYVVDSKAYHTQGMSAILEHMTSRNMETPYVIPIGGSNGLGTWGYIDMSLELAADCAKHSITDVGVTVGSGGTAAGIVLGLYLQGKLSTLTTTTPGGGIRVTGYNNCSTPDYFYNYIQKEIMSPLSLTNVVPNIRSLFPIVDCQGLGYAKSTPQEIEFIRKVARETGVILDPVYTGKAAFRMYQDLTLRGGEAGGVRAMFVHTGGIFGLFGDDGPMLESLVQPKL
eukprot:PhF_6_TR7044/c0_g1_i1/m.10583/K05396/dcyD; D-cysteine desulfhydrase